MSLWSILAAPLLAGNDLRSMTPAIHEILTNREVIAVDQDEAGKQGRRIAKSGEQETWARPLFDGGQAIGMFNRSGEPAKIAVKWSELGLKIAPSRVRDLWARSDVKVDGSEYSAMVPPHGVVMLRVTE
jgi:alpha-galactosidase